MNAAYVNGVVLNECISNKLGELQQGYAVAIAEGLDNAIGFLLEKTYIEDSDPKELLGVLSTLHNARIELLALVPTTEKGGSK